MDANHLQNILKKSYRQSPRTETFATSTSILALAGGQVWPWFVAIVALGFVLRLAPALMMPTLHRPDEVFQNLEPAFRMWSGHGIVTWEWRAGIRSSIYPGFLAGLIGISSELGLGAGGYITVIAVVLSVLSAGTVAIGFLSGWRHAGIGGAIICGLLCATWPDLIYFGPKPLGEIQAGNLLVVAVYVASRAPAQNTNGTVARSHSPLQMFVAGLLLGLVFCVRFQLAPALLLTAVWTARLDFRRAWFVPGGGRAGAHHGQRTCRSFLRRFAFRLGLAKFRRQLYTKDQPGVRR